MSELSPPEAYVPPWKRTKPASSPTATETPSSSSPTSPDLAQSPSSSATTNPKPFSAQQVILSGRRTGTMNFFYYAHKPVNRAKESEKTTLSVKELLEQSRSSSAKKVDEETKDEKVVEGNGTDHSKFTSSSSSSTHSNKENSPQSTPTFNFEVFDFPALGSKKVSVSPIPKLEALSLSQHDPSNTSRPTVPPPHPNEKLLSWISLMPGAHPAFPKEIWTHTDSDLVIQDVRNIGRPIPMFGKPNLEELIAAENAFEGKEDYDLEGVYTNGNGTGRGGHTVRGGRGGGRGGLRGRRGGHMDQKVDPKRNPFLGWWIIDEIIQVPVNSHDLKVLLARKEKANNYPRGRNPLAWASSLQQEWVKLVISPYKPTGSETPTLLPKKGQPLMNPLNIIIDKEKGTLMDTQRMDGEEHVPGDWEEYVLALIKEWNTDGDGEGGKEEVTEGAT